MNEDVECNICHQDPIHPLWKLSFALGYSKEDSYNWKQRRNYKCTAHLSWNEEHLEDSSLLARMWAELPASQWSQLNKGRLGEEGAGLMAAPRGWIKHSIVVTKPRIAWGLRVSAVQALSSRKIRTNPANVRSHTSTMKKRCHCKQKQTHWANFKLWPNRPLTGQSLVWKYRSYHKPLIFPTEAAAHPSLFVVPSQHNTNWCTTNPRSQHEGPMKSQEEFASRWKSTNICQVALLSRGSEKFVMESYPIFCIKNKIM